MDANKKNVSFFSAPPTEFNGLNARLKLLASVSMIGLACLSSGCASMREMGATGAPRAPAESVKVTAVGYGASSPNESYTAGQKRLMAMRASKLDAYRALAEQVRGVRVNGNSTVASLTSQNDSFRVYVDAYLRGAQIVTVTPMADGNYETTMELNLDDRFFGKFSNQGGGSGSGGAVGSGTSYGSNFYFSE
jgi:hypothetical protein